MVNVLLLGGHGKVAQHITRFLVSNHHTVTSLIRDASQSAAVASLGATPVVASISDTDPSPHLSSADWVVWSAGAGGKGGPARTRLIDDETCKKWVSASLAAPPVKKFLLVSASCARRKPASWWDEGDVKSWEQTWSAIGVYCEAKCNADEYLWDESRRLGDAKVGGWEDVCLRPGRLVDEKGSGKVDLGRAAQKGDVSREDVARVAVELLERGGAGGLWIDLVAGQEEIGDAVERVVREKITARE